MMRDAITALLPSKIPVARPHDWIRPRKTKSGNRPRKNRRYSLPVLIVVVVTILLITWSLLIWSMRTDTSSFRSSLIGPTNKYPESYYQSLPAQVFLTTFGWNHPDPRISTLVGRSQFQADLHRGIETHPWYNPNGWQQLNEQRQYSQQRTSTTHHNHQRYYVFFDLETCYEENYPHYGWGYTANSDRDHGRPYLSASGGQIRHIKATCPWIEQTLNSPLFQNSFSNNSSSTTGTTSGTPILVLFDCGWNGPPTWSCLNRQHNPLLNQHYVSIVSESASYKDPSRSILDLGLPPPAIHKVHLTTSQQVAIQKCLVQDTDHLPFRPFLFTFTGNFRHPVRQQLLQLHNPSQGILVQSHFGGSIHTSSIGRGVHAQFDNINASYTTLLSQTQFAGVPRGDNLFSYRFTEALSAGCIPVVYANDWVLPFSSDWVDDWNSMILILAEADAPRTMEFLANISIEQQCQMRQKAWTFYQKYMATPQGVIAGIIQSLEHVVQKYHMVPS